MGRVRFDNTVNGNGDGTVTGYDAESGTTATYNPNDPSAGRTNVSDAFTKRDRYRSLGEAAANQPAYQVDFGAANDDRARGYYARQDQQNAAQMQGAAAAGQAPSAAAIMGNQAAGQSIQSALGATAGAKAFGTRNSPSMASAQMQAQQAQGGMQQQAVGQYGGMRAGELAGALSSYAGTANQMRQGDYATMGLSQQQADAQAQSENAQRSLNQGGQMGFEQLGVNSEQQQVNSRLRQMQIQANANQTQATADAARSAMERQAEQGIITAVGTGVAGSDERMKQGSYMLSDDRTKLAAAWDQGHNEALNKVQEYRQMTPQELKQLGERGNRLANAVRGAKGDAFDEARGQNQSMTGPMPMRQPTSFSRGDPNDAGRPDGPPVAGMVVKGNADLKNREPVWNKDGTVSTVRSMSFNEGGKEILIPTAADGKIYSDNDAIDRYHATGEHLGIFDNEKNATAYAQALHEQEAKRHLVRPKGAGLAATTAKREDPMTKQLAEGLAPHSYEYKPEFAAQEGQQPGEKNVGPMAQNMASNPVTGQAVSQRPDGLLQIDMKKATKLSLAAAGHNAQKIREQQAQIDALKKGSGSTRRRSGSEVESYGTGDETSLGPSGEDNYDPPDYNYIHAPSPLNVASALEQKNGSISPETEAYMRQQGMWGPKTDAILQSRGLKGGR